MVAHAQEVADLLDLTEPDCNTQHFADVFSGNKLLEGMQPYAVCYGGHQFGHWAGQLGDGRAMSLGEVKNQNGAHWEIQLKGQDPRRIPAVRMGARLCVPRFENSFVVRPCII